MAKSPNMQDFESASWGENKGFLNSPSTSFNLPDPFSMSTARAAWTPTMHHLPSEEEDCQEGGMDETFFEWMHQQLRHVVSEEDEHTVPSAAALKKLAAPRSSSSAMMDDDCIDGQQRHAKPNAWNWAGDRSSVLATVSSTPTPSTLHALAECAAQAVPSRAMGDNVRVRKRTTALRPMMVTPEGVRRKRIFEMTQEEQGRVRESNRDNARRNRAVVRRNRDSERYRLDLLNQTHVALQVQVDSWKKRLVELRLIVEERLSPQKSGNKVLLHT